MLLVFLHPFFDFYFIGGFFYAKNHVYHPGKPGACGKSAPQEESDFIIESETTESTQAKQTIPAEAETTAPEATDSLLILDPALLR